jgi:RNA polymerase sigma-70 factor (ECF subfamily)
MPAMEGGPRPEASEEEQLRVLMRRYQAGSMEAFEEIYGRTRSMVRGYVLALTFDRDGAEDVVQETYLQAHRSRHTYDPRLPFKPWLLGVARHVRLTRERARRRRRAHEVEAPDLPDVPVPPEVERLADRDALARALGRLPADRREALVLHHVYGLSFREIARTAGTTEGAARIRASRGLAGLRRLLGGAGDD